MYQNRKKYKNKDFILNRSNTFISFCCGKESQEKYFEKKNNIRAIVAFWITLKIEQRKVYKKDKFKSF